MKNPLRFLLLAVVSLSFVGCSVPDHFPTGPVVTKQVYWTITGTSTMAGVGPAIVVSYSLPGGAGGNKTESALLGWSSQVFPFLLTATPHCQFVMPSSSGTNSVTLTGYMDGTPVTIAGYPNASQGVTYSASLTVN